MRIAYLVAEYPKISETFVSGEIEQHRAAGLDVTVVSLFPCSDRRLSSAAPAECLHAHPTPTLRVLLAGAAMARMTATAPRSAREALRFGKYRDLGKRLLVCRLLERWRWPTDHFDVIHSHFGPMGLLASALRYSGRSSAALVTTFHGNDISETVERYGADYYAPLFAVADRCLGVSQYWAERLVELGARSERTRVQHMGVDCSRLELRPAVAHDGQVRLISVGRLTEKKGHEYTLRALALLQQRAPELDLQLDIIGGGPLLEHLTGLRNELGLASCVRFHDSLTHAEVVARLRGAHLFVLPSVTARSGDMEGIPVSLMEAMAQGLPVVSTRHSGIPELVQHDRCGLLVAERDAPALADSLERLAREPSCWDLMGREGRAIIERDFDTAQLGGRLRQDYADLVTRARRRVSSRDAHAPAPAPLSSF